MLPQRLRTWLWRTNVVLVILALAIWIWGLGADFDCAPPQITARVAAVELTAQPRASVSFSDLLAHCRPFHGWGERTARPEPSVVPPPAGRLPLAALACRAWVSYPNGPDLIVLKSKDPARPELYLPLEGQPHKGIAIERIEPMSMLARVTVRRGEETFTYTMRSPMRVPPGRVRIRPRRGDSARGAAPTGTDAPEGSPCVKLVPFYDTKGALLGARITGIRPGSWLEEAGLHPGDVVVGIGRDRVASVDGVRRTLGSSRGGLSIEVLRNSGREAKRLRLGG